LQIILQNSTIVVAIASAIIALVIYCIDSVFSNILDVFYRLFSSVLGNGTKTSGKYELVCSQGCGGKEKKIVAAIEKEVDRLQCVIFCLRL